MPSAGVKRIIDREDLPLIYEGPTVKERKRLSATRGEKQRGIDHRMKFNEKEEKESAQVPRARRTGKYRKREKGQIAMSPTGIKPASPPTCYTKHGLMESRGKTEDLGEHGKKESEGKGKAERTPGLRPEERVEVAVRQKKKTSLRMLPAGIEPQHLCKRSRQAVPLPGLASYRASSAMGREKEGGSRKKQRGTVNAIQEERAKNTSSGALPLARIEPTTSLQ
ncbi:hypothetical protein DFH07DRAFT_775483 [Mycena maculata]|uniref:Uncharacterized protein n=1 Tax=Mycena maculata TaxID=230809 RepID=A0AAD7N8R0_9AGAR|nr:hypothetical protein DFH07DRAFT_775483 [Mycena maculata]